MKVLFAWCRVCKVRAREVPDKDIPRVQLDGMLKGEERIDWKEFHRQYDFVCEDCKEYKTKASQIRKRQGQEL